MHKVTPVEGCTVIFWYMCIVQNIWIKGIHFLLFFFLSLYYPVFFLPTIRTPPWLSSSPFYTLSYTYMHINKIHITVDLNVNPTSEVYRWCYPFFFFFAFFYISQWLPVLSLFSWRCYTVIVYSQNENLNVYTILSLSIHLLVSV